MTKKQLWTCFGIAVLVGFCSCCVLPAVFNPARRSDESIRTELLEATPLGSSKEVVDLYAKKHFRQDNFFHWRDTDEGQVLQVFYGSYLDHFPLATCVRATWQFDAEGRLSDVHVERWVDGP
jgi:hypothetical protein